MSIKLVTYNIMSGIKYYEHIACVKRDGKPPVDTSAMGEILKKQDADVVCMNEVRGKGGIYGNQTEEIAKYCGYQYMYFAPALGDYYGNAILSKHPIVSAECILVETDEPGERHAETRSIANVMIEINGQNLQVLGTHFGLLESEKQKMLTKLCEIIKTANNPIALMGDFNSMPSSVYVKKLGECINDAMPWCKDEYGTYIGPKGPFVGKKIDYIFVSNGIDVEESRIITETASDHFPCMAKIILKDNN